LLAFIFTHEIKSALEGLLYFTGCAGEKGLNVVVEWLALLLRIWDVPGSNLRPEVSYTD
jgi:hypothetical protein